MASNLRVDSIVPATGANVSIGTAAGGVNIPGVLTYEDVTNVDSVGVITARSGINVTSGNIALSSNGANVSPSGFDFKIRSNTAKLGIHIDNASGTPTLDFGIGGSQGADITTNSTGPIVFKPNNSERLRITHNGEIGIGGANYGTSGQVLTSQGSGSAVQWASPTPAAGSVVQTLSFFGGEETVGAQVTTNKINDTFTPLYTGSKFAVWLTVPNITGQHGAYNTFTVYLGTSSTPQSNTQVIKVGQRTFGTSGQDDLMCLSSADYGNFTCSGTGTHYASLRVTSGQYAVTIARHSDGTDSMKVKLILQEIKQ